MAIIQGTQGDDTLIVNIDTTSVQAEAGTDTVVFSGNYADYTFSQSDSYVPLMTYNTTGQVVSLFGVEQFQFDDTTPSLTTTGSGEFLVNTETTGHQKSPSTTALNDGGFVIAWGSLDDDGYGIYAQRYDASGNAAGGEFLVNTYTSNSQGSASATTLADDSFVITWDSYNQDGDWYGIYAQRYDASGNAVGGEFLVNTETTGNQKSPSTTALNDGGFVIAWEGEDSVLSGIYAQRYNADGSVNGSEFRVNQYYYFNQTSPSITALADGGFVITWTSNGFLTDQYWLDGDGYGIYAQRYNVDGEPLVALNTNTNEVHTISSDFLVNTYATSDQDSPSIAALNDGGFIITQTSDDQDGDGDGIYAQRYNGDAGPSVLVLPGNIIDNVYGSNAVGDEFQVNTHTTYDQNMPSIATLIDGGFVIAWQSNAQDGNGYQGYGIYAQRYDASGNAVGGEFLVNTYTTSQQKYPSITALIDGGFVIAWQSYAQDGDIDGIFAQRYDSEGNPLGTVTLINEVTGTTADDILNGTTGIDEISTGLGADVVYALAGNDTITLTADSTWGIGYFSNNVSNDNSVGTNEKISLEGLNRFNDVIDGGDDVDALNLTTGNDAFFIDDVYSEHHSSLTLSSTTQGTDSTARVIDLETINAGEGNDTVDLTSTNFVLATGVTINGEAGNDNLWGSNGNDVIDGGTGDDSIFGGTGSDTLTGGTGADIFQFTATSGFDDILDFDITQDSIQLYYRAGDDHTNADLDLTNGVLTWDVLINDVDNVVIDLSATVTSSDLNDLDALISFVEIVQRLLSLTF